MKDWKNISKETSWIWRTINITIQITRLIGKESNKIVLQYILVNLILPGFFRTKIFLGGKNDPPSCYLENGSLYIHVTWQTYTFHLFVNIFNFWWSCYDIMKYINMKYEKYLRLCHHKICKIWLYWIVIWEEGMECCQQIIHNFLSCGHMVKKFSDIKWNRTKLKVNKF